ncbi:MAG: fructose-bisphosphatase class II, partial [Clostridium sp.]|uniref:fructose-bisphosphatase class II n=1 Tax=Clostridium sp. TaxID=1506 RepID=UPI00345BF997|nr:fructose-bisphosphatase class II [Clostridium sp.]
MNAALAIEFSRVTEMAALAAHTWFGRGDKNAADDAAVKAMRYMLNLIDMDAEIVIGEGEIDEAPMLYIGEKVGSGMGELISIAVDPIDGTHMTAMGQSNAISVLAAGGRNTFLKAPDMYMEKLQDCEYVRFPKIKGDQKPVYYVFNIRAERRDELVAYLKENEIVT